VAIGSRWRGRMSEDEHTQWSRSLTHVCMVCVCCVGSVAHMYNSLSKRGQYKRSKTNLC
jgi:hypothetical protein